MLKGEEEKLNKGLKPLVGATEESGGRPEIPEAIWEVVELLISGEYPTAEIKLREIVQSDDFRRVQSHSKQIGRIEQVFQQTAKRSPWPADFARRDLIYWRARIAAVLAAGLPLARVIDDLTQTAAGKRNLLYYLSAEKGQRASRWEMLWCDYRDEQAEKERLREAEDARRFFAQGDVDPPVRTAEPDWVARLKNEREMLARELDTQPAPARRREIDERIRMIGAVLRAKGMEDKS